VQAMRSLEEEEVDFSTPVLAKGNVEHWLLDVEKMMKTTLYDVHKHALQQCVLSVAFFRPD
jgi:hypothetical protein